MTRGRLALASVVYVVMGGVAIALGTWWNGVLPVRHPEPRGALGEDAVWVSLGLGVVLGLSTVASTRVLLARTAWARALRRELRVITVGEKPLGLALLGLSSGIAEELLFRGAVQPALGLVLTSLGFGLMHVGPSRAFLPWTVWAVVMGFLLGAIFEYTGALEGPIVAHVLVNTVNLRAIADHDASLGDTAADGEVPPPRLVAAPPREGERRSGSADA